jgi:integrase
MNPGFTLRSKTPARKKPVLFDASGIALQREKEKGPAWRRKPPVSLTDEEFHAVLEIANKRRFRDLVMIVVTYWHGLRASELVNLRRCDFNLEVGEILIRRGKGSEGGWWALQEHEDPLQNERALVKQWLEHSHEYGEKGGSKRGYRARRTAAPSVSGVPRLTDGPSLTNGAPFTQDNAKRQQSSQNVAFSSEDPNPRVFPVHRCHFWKLVNRYARQAGLPARKCKTHAIKHTIAKHLIRAGVPVNDVMEWMGWTSLSTPMWYMRADVEELSDRIGRAIRSRSHAAARLK